MTLGDKGTVFVGNRNLSNVYAIVDKGGKREVKTVLKGLTSPNGVVFDKGTLYVAERHRITRYDGIEDRLDNPPKPVVVIDNLDPNKQPGHFWKYMAMGPDGKLYFNIGSPQNITMPTATGSDHHARRPEDRRDREGRARRAQQRRHGLPSEDQAALVHRACARLARRRHAGRRAQRAVAKRASTSASRSATRATTLDPQYGKNRSCAEFTPPKLKLGAPRRAAGLRFYTGKMFPNEYTNNIFIAQHGSWNRTRQAGLQRGPRELRRARATPKSGALPRRLPDRREGRPADVGPAGRRAAACATARCSCRTTTTASSTA